MPYSKNPYLPKARGQAVKLVKTGKSIRLVARHFGVHASTVSRWVKKAELLGLVEIPTLSSKPKSSKIISRDIALKILNWRSELKYDEIIKKLSSQGVKISLSSVKRIIKNNLCTK